MQENLSLIFSSKLTVGIELNSRETARFSDFESRGRKFAKRRFFQAFVLETKEPQSCKQ